MSMSLGGLTPSIGLSSRLRCRLAAQHGQRAGADPIDEIDAERFACNALVVGRNVIMHEGLFNYSGHPRIMVLENNGRPRAPSLAVLCGKLRTERLLIGAADSAGSELYVLRELNTRVQEIFRQLHQSAWIHCHERAILRRLIKSDPSIHPDTCYKLLAGIDSVTPLEAHKVIDQHAEPVAQLLNTLLLAPKTVAELMNAVEKSFNYKLASDFNGVVFNLLYCPCSFPLEEKAILELLSRLASIQLGNSSDPRRLLRKENTAFSQLYKLFHEELYSAKMFLTAALHEPIMFLLSQEDVYLDIDPGKAVIRYPPKERIRNFGDDSNSTSYKERVEKHREAIIVKLTTVVTRFVVSIKRALPYFPPQLRWLLLQLNEVLLAGKCVCASEATLICSDLVFTDFLCAAVIDPEPLGIISDTPIGHIARSNLIQVGQVLQALALSPYEQPAPYFDDVLPQFEQQSMSAIVEELLRSPSEVTLDAVVQDGVCDTDGCEIYRRQSFMGNLAEINAILAVLRSPILDEISDSNLKKHLKTVVKKMPAEFSMQDRDSSSSSPATNNNNASSPCTPPHRSHSSGRLKNLADKVQSVASRGHQRLLQTSGSPFLHRGHNQRQLAHNSSSSLQETAVASNSPEPSKSHGASCSNSVRENGNEMAPHDDMVDVQPMEVLVFPINSEAGQLPIGLSPEELIIQMHHQKDPANPITKTRFPTSASEGLASDRTNEASDDDEEVGDQNGLNIQGEQMDISNKEADPAEGSTCSSNENVGDGVIGDGMGDEEEDISTLPDNISDVAPISANISARGSNASLSGERVDTPFSGGTGAIAVAIVPPSEQQNMAQGRSATVPYPTTNDAVRRGLPPIPVAIKKQNTEGLEEKFGKFTLPPQDHLKYHGDETYSLVSDSWSTDVGVASDNEGGVTEARSESSAPPTLRPQRTQDAPLQREFVLNPRSALLLPDGNAEKLSFPPLSHSTLSTTQPEQSPMTSHKLIPESTDALASTEAAPNIEEDRAFLDLKRKLRSVLSMAPQMSMVQMAQFATAPRNGPIGKPNKGGNIARIPEREELIVYLNFLLAEATSSRNETMCAQISEVLRSITNLLDDNGVRKLLKALSEDHKSRAPYLAYLRQSRLALLELNSRLGVVWARIERLRERSLTAECTVEIVVRFYLEMNSKLLREFMAEFQSCKAQDEKAHVVESTLSQLHNGLRIESMWHHAAHSSVEYAKKSLERALMAKIYHLALYPNGEADMCRDGVFYASVKRLKPHIGVGHEELGINKRFHGEAPWPRAQAQLLAINAYKSPRDKLTCVVRCCEAIESLVNFERRSASADDTLPVVVFVLIQANPPALLSNIQYINDFYSAAMQGKEAYWWTQLTSAVEFTKQLMGRTPRVE